MKQYISGKGQNSIVKSSSNFDVIIAVVTEKDCAIQLPKNGVSSGDIITVFQKGENSVYFDSNHFLNGHVLPMSTSLDFTRFMCVRDDHTVAYYTLAFHRGG